MTGWKIRKHLISFVKVSFTLKMLFCWSSNASHGCAVSESPGGLNENTYFELIVNPHQSCKINT